MIWALTLQIPYHLFYLVGGAWNRTKTKRGRPLTTRTARRVDVQSTCLILLLALLS